MAIASRISTGGTGRVRAYRPLVSSTWKIPEGFQESGWALVPAGPVLARIDYEAVKASRELLQNLFQPNDSWPPENLTLEQDRADLAWHAREFRQRRSFAYSIVTPEFDRCLGCLYLYPSMSPVHDAEAYLWLRPDLPMMTSRRIEQTVEMWVDSAWPFKHMVWPGRYTPWLYWELFQAPNYYTQMRYRDDAPADPLH